MAFSTSFLFFFPFFLFGFLFKKVQNFKICSWFQKMFVFFKNVPFLKKIFIPFKLCSWIIFWFNFFEKWSMNFSKMFKIFQKKMFLVFKNWFMILKNVYDFLKKIMSFEKWFIIFRKKSSWFLYFFINFGNWIWFLFIIFFIKLLFFKFIHNLIKASWILVIKEHHQPCWLTPC
jgi:hypothetical protein